jgi:putative Holliday junction resolvase
MGRLLAFDYGLKRVGIAVTDPLQIIANGLTTIHTSEVFNFLENYLKTEKVDEFIVGIPKRLNNTDTHLTQHLVGFTRKLQQKYPHIPIKQIDERFTSKMAFQTMIVAGLNKKQRSNKELIDKISATIILQSYLEQRNNLNK